MITLGIKTNSCKQMSEKKNNFQSVLITLCWFLKDYYGSTDGITKRESFAMHDSGLAFFVQPPNDVSHMPDDWKNGQLARST